MKITVDTNVLISATFWNGDSNRIIGLVEQKKITLVMSQAILKEYANVLQYEEIQDKVKRKNLSMKYSVLKIVELSTIVHPIRKIKVVEDDPDDDMVIECALEGRVKYIISQDEHLLKLKEFEGIKNAQTKKSNR